MKYLLALSFSVLLCFSANHLLAQEVHKKSTGLRPGDILMEHVLDANEFHFISFGKTDVTIPLPIILYSPQKGFSCFSSSKFNHGATSHNGYRLIDEAYLEKLKEQGIDLKKDHLNMYSLFPPEIKEGRIIPVTADDSWDRSVKYFDLSITRNVIQMFLSVILLVWIMLAIASKYKKGQGLTSAPKGFQNAVEPVITFIRDEVGKPLLGVEYEKYMPYLLTVFFFILINSLIGLIPGTANVTGNIAFTGLLGVISFIVILFSSNKHYWSHIVNPPGVPGWVKIILVPVEVLGIFTKPFALIIRLFANMIAGHMIITSLVLLIFIFGALNTAVGYGFSPISIAFSVFIYLIEILIDFIQAFIFTMLTAVFIAQAFEGAHGVGHDDAIVV